MTSPPMMVLLFFFATFPTTTLTLSPVLAVHMEVASVHTEVAALVACEYAL